MVHSLHLVGILTEISPNWRNKGNILDVQLPEPQEKFSKNPHRGFGFIEYDNAQDASNAIDNMDMNILAGKVIKCNYAKPLKAAQMVGQGNRAIWSTEEWIQEYGKDSINKEEEQRWYNIY